MSATREAFLKPISWLWFRALLQQTRVPETVSLVAPAMLRALVFMLPYPGSFEIIPAAKDVRPKGFFITQDAFWWVLFVYIWGPFFF